jgi:hypothetical protein
VVANGANHAAEDVRRGGLCFITPQVGIRHK